ncbi:centrosomal protein 97kDa [Chamberlinius hualienensis]
MNLIPMETTTADGQAGAMEGDLTADDQHAQTANEKMDNTDAEMVVNNSEVVDLSGSGIRKLEKSTFAAVRSLILDRNELNKLDNVESYGNLRKLSLRENKFVRMYCVCRLIHLRELDLSNNNVVVIEGLRELIHLKVLRLGGNKIKAIEHISTNIVLEVLDLSNNGVVQLTDLSHLKMLHTLLLNNNFIKQINGSSTYLPGSIAHLNIANNSICDLNQISNLGGLSNLEELNISNNPCIDLSKSPVGFDYRPFVVNWCQSVKVLDDFVVTSKESLKAEWLYSMGKGRQYRIGDHAELIDYLSNVCPLTSLEDLTSEEDVKLNRILKQRRQLQQQLLNEMTNEDKSSSRMVASSSTSSPTKSAAHHDSTERSKSSLPVRTQFKSATNVAIISSSAHQFHSTSPRQTRSAGSKKSSALANDDFRDSTESKASFDFHDHHNDDNDASFYTLHKGDVPSDVPESSEAYKPLESPVTSSPLKSETQYVPVPETMLSPDFRPISNSFHAGMYEGDGGGDVEADFPSSWASWTQPSQSSIPRNVTLPRSASRNSPKLSNDWPVAKRPAQVQKVQKTARPLSLSPSNYRRSPASKHKSSPRPSTSSRTREKATNVDDSSSDSDMSVSKLVLVREAIARKSKDTPPTTTSESKRIQTHIEDQKHKIVSNGLVHHSTPPPVKKEKLQVSKQVKYSYVEASATGSQRETAATRIQALWKGYITRQRHPEATAVRLELRLRRAEDHVRELQKQLVTTQEELACEKRFRSMQMDAIQSLWVQVQQLQSNYLEEKGNTENSSDKKLEYKAESTSNKASAKAKVQQQ